MVSTSYPESAQDWHGRFIADLAAGLGRCKGITLSLWAPPGDLPSTVAPAATAEEAAWLLELSRRGGIAHHLRNARLSAPGTVAGLLRRLRSVYKRNHADVVHAQWLQNALPLWGTKTPLVASVLGTDFALLRVPGMRAALRAVFRQRPTILAPNAHWMVLPLQQAFGNVAAVHAIPFGVDERWFRISRNPGNGGQQHWLAITRVTKGKIGDLFEWGEGLFGTHRMLHLFGPMQEPMTLPDWVTYHGPTYPDQLIDTWFPMATGVITLSRHDEGRPQVLLEAMAAGLPVIASDLPAHRDIIRHSETGWIARSIDELANGLSHIENANVNMHIGMQGRAWVKREIGTWHDCADRYVSLYRAVLGERDGDRD
jgi:hypothetical protein